MKIKINKEELKNKALKAIIPINIAAIIAGVSINTYVNASKNKETYYPVSEFSMDDKITLNGFSKISGKSVAKQIDEKSDDTVYMFKMKSKDKNTYVPVFVSKSGNEVTLNIIDVNDDDFDGFNYGKVMINEAWYDISSLDKKDVTVDPISTEELSEEYDFYLDNEWVQNDITNSSSMTSSYVLKHK